MKLFHLFMEPVPCIDCSIQRNICQLSFSLFSSGNKKRRFCIVHFVQNLLSYLFSLNFVFDFFTISLKNSHYVVPPD